MHLAFYLGPGDWVRVVRFVWLVLLLDEQQCRVLTCFPVCLEFCRFVDLRCWCQCWPRIFFNFCFLDFYFISLYMYMSTTGVSGAHRVSKRGMVLLELKLPLVVNHHMGARNWTWSSARVTSTLGPPESLKSCESLKGEHGVNYVCLCLYLSWDRISYRAQTRLELTV